VLQRDHYIAIFKYKDFSLATGPEPPMSMNISERGRNQKVDRVLWKGNRLLVRLLLACEIDRKAKKGIDLRQ
jgi:hypothetical protein